MSGQELTSTLPFFLVFLSQRSVNSVVRTLEHNITHDFEMTVIFKTFVIVFNMVKNFKVFSYHLMTKTALRAPLFKEKLQKPKSNGYDNHTACIH